MPSFLLLFYANNTLSIIFAHETTGVFPLFFPKQCMIAHVHKVFFGNSKFSTKTEIMLVFVRNKRVLEIQVIP